MSPDYQPLTAIERARIAYELMMHRERAAAQRRRTRERSRTIAITAVCGCMFVALLGSAIYYDWLPVSLRSQTMSRKADNGKFIETRNGHVRSFIQGNTCQELQFNNDRGVYVAGNLVPCQVEVQRREQPTAEMSKGARVNSIRDAFTSR